MTSGEYPPGSLLPSERKLAEQLIVNRTTIARAYDELMARGLVERKRGSGTRVSENSLQKIAAGTTDWNTYVERGALRPLYPLVKQIKNAATERKDTIDLSGNELAANYFSSNLLSGVVYDIKEEEIAENVGKVHPQGQPELREELVNYMRKFYKVETTSSSIIVTSGIQQSLFLILQSLLSPGDAIAIESPSYFYSYPLFQSLGLRVYGLPIDKDGVNPDDIITLYKKHRIKFVLLIPTFQNPTGTVLSEERRKRIAEIVAELKIPISEGDPYYPIHFDETQLNQPIKSFDQNGNVMYVGSLAKTTSTQLGIGWIAGPRMVIDRIMDSQQQTDFGVNLFSQLVAR